MIGALAVKRGDIEKKDLATFADKHGMVGWAPTQGHIPSGVPYIGFGRQDILDGKIRNAMIIGKGSLFLGRMTNLFDGVSFIIEANQGKQEEKDSVSEEQIKGLIAQALKNFATNLLAE
jgi:glycine/sarcosine/betaine reductase complex component C subunit beta